jgi:type III secretion protein J
VNNQSLSANTRWPLPGVVMAALLLCACTGEVDLHTRLSDNEANRVMAALRGDGMKAVKMTTKNGVTVRVSEADLARATQVLSAQGLPQHTAARMGEVFKKEGLISSPLEERARYVYALSQELETTLAQIDGVVVARVHVVLPEKIAPGEPMQPPSAAVFIKHLPALEPDVISHRIKQLVARAIPGMGLQALDRVSAVFVVADAVPKRPAEPFDAMPWAVSAAAALLLAVVISTGLYLRRTGWRPRLRRAGLAPPAATRAPAAASGPDRPPVVGV